MILCSEDGKSAMVNWLAAVQSRIDCRTTQQLHDMSSTMQAIVLCKSVAIREPLSLKRHKGCMLSASRHCKGCAWLVSSLTRCKADFQRKNNEKIEKTDQ